MKRGLILVLTVIVIAVVATVALSAQGHSVTSLVGAHADGDTASASPLPRTQLAALPSRDIANGTAPIAVTLAAPVSPTSPTPMLVPKVAGKWTIVGDSEVFTP
jgi:hypothetical protein